jgi:DNA-binding IclR family transcriptional regulator
MSRNPIATPFQYEYSYFMTSVSAPPQLLRLTRLLELFARRHSPLSSQEIAEALGTSRSTTASLLKSLTELGWLTVDRRSATYFPSARFANWSRWLLDIRWLDPRLAALADRLQRDCGETVSISAIGDLAVEVVYVSAQSGGIRLVIEVGQTLPLLHSAIGWAHCTTLPDATIASLASRSQLRLQERVDLREVRREVRLARERGYAFADSAVIPDVAAYAAALPTPLSLRPLVLSVGGPSERIAKLGDSLPQKLLAAVESTRDW